MAETRRKLTQKRQLELKWEAGQFQYSASEHSTRAVNKSSPKAALTHPELLRYPARLIYQDLLKTVILTVAIMAFLVFLHFII